MDPSHPHYQQQQEEFYPPQPPSGGDAYQSHYLQHRLYSLDRQVSQARSRVPNSNMNGGKKKPRMLPPLVSGVLRRLRIFNPLFWDFLFIYRIIIITGSIMVTLITIPLIYARLFIRLFIPRQQNRVAGKITLVTGAGNGIGKELALAVSRLGAVVVCVDVDATANDATAARIRAEGGAASSYTLDVSNREQVEQVAQVILDEVGDVEILMNNAGVRRVRPFLSHTDVQIEKVINTNLYGQIWMMRAFLPRFVQRKKGTIVSLSGVAGYGGMPNMLPFTASKFAVRGLMEGLYIELRQRIPDHKIHLMTVAPFVVNTGMVQGSIIAIPGLVNMVGAEEAAQAIVDNMRREEVVIFIPKIYYYIFNFLRILPLKVQLLLTDFIDTGIQVGYDLKDD